MNSIFKRMLWLLACLLMSLLCFIFVINNKILLAGLLIIILAIAVMSWIKLGKTTRNFETNNKFQDILEKLPSPGYQQPIIITYQNNEQNIFLISSSVRQTDHGYYIFIKNLNEIDDFVEALLIKRPSWYNQISALIVITPEQQDDMAVLMGQLHEFYYQIGRIKKLTKFDTQSVIVTCLDGEASPWFELTAPNQKLTVWVNGQTPVSYKDWILNCQDSEKKKRLTQVLHVNSWLEWFHSNVVQEYIKNEPDYTLVPPVSMNIIFTSLNTKENNLWKQWLKYKIGLSEIDHSINKENTIFLPDFMIRLLPHQIGYHPITKAITYAVGIICVFLGAGFIGSYINNKSLLRSISHDIKSFYNIPENKEIPKNNAFIQLQKDADLLDQYFSNDVPLRLDMGLYTGSRINPPLLEAIKSYNPDKVIGHNPEVEKAIIIQGALFDVGQSTFKSGSTKILINTLTQIKAKPGWLILIAGHTDNTGNEELNQKLSRERAEAVQRWMMQNGDIPSNCFAIQGYGSTQPAADNSTDAGRAANRRVEVRLIPDKSSICRVISKGSNEHQASPNQGDQ